MQAAAHRQHVAAAAASSSSPHHVAAPPTSRRRNPQQQHQQHLLHRSSSSSRPAPTQARAAAASSSSAPGLAPRSQRASAASSISVRRLILLRHADSEASAKLRDHDRPISLQGRREAAKVAKALCEAGWVPDLIIASNSRRTRQTLDTMAEAAAELGEVDAHFLGSLYTVAALDGQTKHHLEETIRSVASDAANFTVMCVGHNKGWEEAASAFAKQAVRLSTASAALFETMGATWEDVTTPEAGWKLVEVISP